MVIPIDRTHERYVNHVHTNDDNDKKYDDGSNDRNYENLKKSGRNVNIEKRRVIENIEKRQYSGKTLNIWKSVNIENRRDIQTILKNVHIPEKRSKKLSEKRDC